MKTEEDTAFSADKLFMNLSFCPNVVRFQYNDQSQSERLLLQIGKKDKDIEKLESAVYYLNKQLKENSEYFERERRMR